MAVIFKICKLSFLIMLTIVFTSQAKAQSLSKKWFPGHYLYTDSETMDGVMLESKRDLVKNNPNFTGYHVRYYWRALESEKGVYDFTIIEEDLKTAKADGKKLIVHIHDRDHRGRKISVPDYLTTDPIYEGGVYRPYAATAQRYKYMPKLWVPAVADRWGELLMAFGKKFDQDSTLAYVCMEETSLNDSKDQPGFSSSRLRDAYKVIYTAAAKALPTTIFSQYANWAGGLEREDADDMMAHLAAFGHGLGGPDALVGRRPFDGVTSLGALDNWFGVYYKLYKGVIPITSSSQAPTYKANNPLKVLNYAVNELSSNFMSWAPVTKEQQEGNLYGIDEVIEVINAENGRINKVPPLSIIK